MSTTIKGFTVTLEPDIRQEIAEKIAAAIRLTVGVIAVELIEETPSDCIIEVILTRTSGKEYYDRFFLACNEVLTQDVESRREWEPKQ